jgi:hypothetical protein
MVVAKTSVVSHFIFECGLGIELWLSLQVIKDRKWKELTAAFNFPHTTSSAAYVLRKYYMGILHHYEQVYYFGTQGHLVPPPSKLRLPDGTYLQTIFGTL